MSLEAAAREHGTPLYVYSRARDRGRLPRLRAGLRRRAAPDLLRGEGERQRRASCGCSPGLGAGADIVSGGELLAARRAGFAPERIVFAGVGKSDAEIALGLEHGIGEWNAESEEEIAAASPRRPRRAARGARVSLRVNPDIDARSHPYISTGLREAKFGVDIGPRAAILRRARATARASRSSACSATSARRSPRSSRSRRRRARSPSSAGSCSTRASRSRRSTSAAASGVSYDGSGVPDPRALAAAVLPARRAACRCTLLLEPGRSLVAAAGVLLTRVLYVKEGHGKRFVIVDAGMNDLLRPALYDAFHRIEPVRHARPARRSSSTWSGPVCETSDFLARGASSSGPSRATCSPCATPAPTASRCPRTTTCARAPRRSWSRTAASASSVGARRSRTWFATEVDRAVERVYFAVSRVADDAARTRSSGPGGRSVE